MFGKYVANIANKMQNVAKYCKILQTIAYLRMLGMFYTIIYTNFANVCNFLKSNVALWCEGFAPQSFQKCVCVCFFCNILHVICNIFEYFANLEYFAEGMQKIANIMKNNAKY